MKTPNNKAKGHVFDYNPTDALENLILTGESVDTKKALQFFPTPREVVELMWVLVLASSLAAEDILSRSFYWR